MSYFVSFDRSRFDAFRANDRPGPIHMFNLVRLRDNAVYEDSRQSSGAEAYARYGKASNAALEAVGGKLIWRGKMEQMLIGPDDKAWDICFIVEYAQASDFLDMIKRDDYQAAVVHRQAAVLDSRLIRMVPGQGSSEFG